ncbi:hypothetical protein K469DRAFT_675468 [Zopfia rhizophila CBS 207.26]|uniref:Uncharacterized protein n=1 Tax=Zopfia rhizophila CBS 207.26 TaxID=1314779 RepID=A0A6A6DGG4_9PEZI|nr:hypothetical protein K469DRAFT_675468 [Zopfia rhizophila CBS 207.26]
MNVALNRKRSASTPEPDDAGPRVSGIPFTEPLKRTKTEGELDEIDVISPSEAWPVDVPGILSSPTLPGPRGGNLQSHDNMANYAANSSILVFCVQGDNYQLHYNLLCSALPDLYALSPSLQAFVLCRDPSTHSPSTTAPFSLPLIQAVGPSYNHFVRLGLLHPIGGGLYPLDALVVVDARGRRRLVLPFGWGAGRHAGNAGGGRTVQSRLMEMLKGCIETLSHEP